MKSLAFLSVIAGAGTIAVLTSIRPAEARMKCTRVETPDHPGILAITNCTGVTLPPFFRAIGWQRLETQTWPGSTNEDPGTSPASDTPSKEDDCGPSGYSSKSYGRSGPSFSSFSSRGSSFSGGRGFGGFGGFR